MDFQTDQKNGAPKVQPMFFPHNSTFFCTFPLRFDTIGVASYTVKIVSKPRVVLQIHGGSDAVCKYLVSARTQIPPAC